jgi:hypothetical protein
MAFDDLVLGQAANSKIIEIMLRDSTTGQGKTGLTFESAGMTAYYVREGSTANLITLIAGTVGDAYSSGKFAEVDATNMPGLYQLHIPNAALATAANAVNILIKGTGFIGDMTKILILGYDPRTVLPNAIPGADGGVFIAGTNAALTITGAVALSDTLTVAKGVAITNSTAGGAGLAVTGNGAGAGITATGGATGPGLLATGGGNDAAADGIRATAGGALANGVETDRVGVTGATTLTGGINAGAVSGTLANDLITAASIANGAIDNATFAADVGSTAHATNILALAVDKSLDAAMPAVPTTDSVNYKLKEILDMTEMA